MVATTEHPEETIVCGGSVQHKVSLLAVFVRVKLSSEVRRLFSRCVQINIIITATYWKSIVPMVCVP